MKIALMFIATGKEYRKYINPVIESVRKHFLKGHTVDIFLWTDSEEEHDATIFKVLDRGFPEMSLKRYHMFLEHKEILSKYDYIFYCDIDMLFVDDVDDSILGKDLTVVLHPGQPKDSIEKIRHSTAYLDHVDKYFAGAFQGGKSEAFIRAMETMKKNIDIDEANKLMAIWHDESHWNHYCFYNTPSVILGYEYCYPKPITLFYTNTWGRDYKPKLCCLQK
jgi:histo-blood group ABO system transferase